MERGSREVSCDRVDRVIRLLREGISGLPSPHLVLEVRKNFDKYITFGISLGMKPLRRYIFRPVATIGSSSGGN